MSQTSELTSWIGKVTDYVDRMVVLVDSLNHSMEELGTPSDDESPDRIQHSISNLAALNAEMESMVFERETLLNDSDAPKEGSSLVEKLQGSLHLESFDLALRCEQLSDALTDSHQRAVSSFVCVYHLAEVSGEIVGILSGASKAMTYGPQGGLSDDQGGQVRRGGGGGLFNEAG